MGDQLINALVKSGIIIGSFSSGKNQTSPQQSIEFTNLGLKEYPECGTPLEVLEYHKLDGKSLAQRISGVTDIVTEEKIKQKYTADAPQ